MELSRSTIQFRLLIILILLGVKHTHTEIHVSFQHRQPRKNRTLG